MSEKIYWNPWHGCHKVSEGCQNCYMYEQDKQYKMQSNVVTKTSKFNTPIKKNRQRELKYPAGTVFPTCFTSDFFIEEADEWRQECWDMMRYRNDCIFYIITKRPERIKECLPPDWGENYKHVLINVTAENQKRLDERIPILLDLPLAFKGITIAPMLEEMTLDKYLATGQIHVVSIGGESHSEGRDIHFDWVKKIQQECLKYNENFIFHQTGTHLVVNGKRHTIPLDLEKEQALKAGLNTAKEYQIFPIK